MALVTEAIRTEVAQLYVALFGRAPLAEGLGFYAQKMASGMTVAQVAQEMYNLDVARSYYPSAATADEIVTSFFRNVLGREPADAGKAYWVGRLNAANLVDPAHAQGLVIAEMIDSVVAYSGVNGAALQAKALFNNKVTIALAFNQAQTSHVDGGFPAHLSDDTLRDLSDDILNSVTSSSDVSNPHAFVWNFLGGSAESDLTVRRDVVSGYETYNSQPEYTPGGDDFVNTLQDEDSLVGTAGSNDTLNVLIGAPNDSSESIISPVLRSIEVVNAEFTGGSAGLFGVVYAGYGGLLGEDIYLDSAYGLSFQNTEGVREVNIDRITDTNAYVVILSLQDSTTAISLSDTRPVNGLVEFNWAEGELAGSDTVTLTLDNVRLNALNITSGDWQSEWEVLEDEGYGIEHLIVDVNGTTNIDQFSVFPNGAEPVAGPAVPYYYGTSIAPVPPGSPQVIEFTTAAGAPLEINSLVMPGVNAIRIHAAAEVLFTGNERTNADANENSGLDRNAGAFSWTSHLEQIVIDGTAAGDVWLNGVNSGSDGDNTVVIEGSEMLGNLAARIDDETAYDLDSSVDSGAGDDEIVTNGSSRMAITTRDGKDHVHIGAFDGGDSGDIIRTGAGADVVIVEGTVYADIDTWSAVATNVTKTAAKSDTAADGDLVAIYEDVDSANLSTGEGNDTISVDDAIIKTALGGRTIDTGNGNDVLRVLGSDEDVSLAKGYAVEMGAGNDLVSLDQDNAGTISTSAGNDTVSVGDDVHEGANISTGIDDDIVSVGDDNEATIDTSTGHDKVTVGGDVEGPGRVLTGEGNDTVSVADDLDVLYADYVGFEGNGSDDDGITTETDFDEEENAEEEDSVGTFNVPGTGKLGGDPDKTTTVAARIETGTGNDIVTVGDQLHAAPQWNDNKIDTGKSGNFNSDDTVNIVGSAVLLGAGNDTLTIGDYASRSGADGNDDPRVLEEGVLVDAGADDDTVTINHNGPVVLARDNSEINEFGKSAAGSPDGLIEPTLYDVWYVEREVAVGQSVSLVDGKLVSTQDTTGAMVYLGTGNDAITFNDVAYDVSPNPAERPASDSARPFSDVTVLVDRGAILDGSEVASKTAGSETDTMTVRTVDQIDVVQSRAWHAIDTAGDSDSDTDAIVVGGINARDDADGQGGYIRNIDTINLVIENTVTPFEENSGETAGVEAAADSLHGASNEVGVDGYVATDEDSNSCVDGPVIRIDEFQVNTDLNTINLVSNEQRLKLQDTIALSKAPEAKVEDPYYVDGHTNGYIEGQMTAFEIDSHRYDVALTLKAYEVTGLTPWHNGDLDKDFTLDGKAWPYEGFNSAKNEWVGEGWNLRDDCEIDVTVSVNMDAYAEWNSGATKNRGFTLDLLANDDLANQSGEGNYDVRIISEDEYATDDEGNPVYTAQDGSDRNPADGNTSDQTISAEGMTAQDVNALEDDLINEGSLIRQYARDITLNVKTGASHSIDMYSTYVGNPNFLGEDTTLTVNVTGGAGQGIELHDVRADSTKVTGASDMYLYMLTEKEAEGQAFKIDLSGTSGTNLIDMTEDGAPGKEFDDTVTGGTGQDLLLLSGGDDIDSFAHINGVESLALIFEEGSDETSDLNVDASGALNELLIVNYNEENSTDGIADEDDGTIGFHTVNVTVTGSAADANRLTINADVDISEDLEPAFCNPDLDSTRHSDGLLINAETKGAERTDLDIWVNTAEGTQVRLRNEANEFARVYATVSALADTHVNDNEDPVYNGQGDDEGELRLSVLAGGVDEIYLINADRSTASTPAGEGTGSGHNVYVKVEDSWATNVDQTAKAYDLKIDASAINTTDNSTFNTWNELDGSLETDANLYIIGSQDRDDIDGGAQNDTLDGGAGTDLLYGHKGNDSLVGGTGNDQLAGDDDGDLTANGGNDTLRGGDGSDLLYGGAKADVLTGGKDNDVFVYTRRSDSNSGFDKYGIDVITDFNAYGEATDTVPGTDQIDIRNMAFDPGFLNGSSGTSVGDFLTGKKMVFGWTDEAHDSQYLGGNAKNFADAQSRTMTGNGIIEAVYQQDEGVLWFDLNDDGTLNNNDLRINVALPAGTTEFDAAWINGIDGKTGNGYTDFFQAVHSDPAQNKGTVYSLGTVVNDHVIIDADKETSGTVTGLDATVGHGGLATFGGNDTVTVSGSNSDDDLVIDLGDGNDTVRAGMGDETLIGGAGNDSIAAGSGDDEVYGGNGDDTVFGEAGEDYIEATPGNDYLDGGTENDTLISTSGDDTLYGGDGNDVLIAGTMDDWDYPETDRDFVDGGAGNDRITTGSDADVVYGGTGGDSIYTDDGADFVDAGSDSDSVYAGNDDDTVWGGTGYDHIYAGSGDDWVDGGSDADMIFGGSGSDELYGMDGDDSIDAGEDNDYVEGGAGSDDIFGGYGSDELYGQDGEDAIYAGEDNDYVEGGKGEDLILGEDGSDEIYGQDGEDSIMAGEDNDYVEGGAGEDVIFGEDGSDEIYGQDGEDFILAGADNDYVEGGAGEDQIYGEDGDDEIYGQDGEDLIAGEDGDDTILGQDGEDYLLGEDGNDSIDGGAGEDMIGGGNGDDWIHGRVGDDTLLGEDGDDTIYGGDPTESLNDDDFIAGGDGNDIAWGYDGDDTIGGEDGNDTLYGGDETDIVSGGDDADLLYGEEAEDLMFGGTPWYSTASVGGNDVFYFDDSDDGDDTMFGGQDADMMFGGSGDDHVDGGTGSDDLYGDWAVGEDVIDYLAMMGEYSDANDIEIWTDGYAGNDVVDGGWEDDTIQGGFGDDTLYGGYDDDLIFGEYKPDEYSIGLPPGPDYWLYNAGEDIVDPSLLPTLAFPATSGNDDLIWGGDGNDTILGDISYDLNDFNASVNGVGGDDTLYGGDGYDLIGGGGGDDLIYGGDEVDTVRGGYGDDDIYGGNGDDLLDGNNGDDYIDGGEDDDQIWGAEGNDTLIGDTGADSDDPDNQDSIWGGSGDDSIYAGADDDFVEGGDGDDSIYGGNGDDELAGNDDDDYIEGNDDDDDIWGGDGDDTLLGNADDDWLSGGDGDDSLLGGADDDTLLGGDDDDWLWGESGADSIVAGDGADSVYGGADDDEIYLDDDSVTDDLTDVDWVHLNVGTSTDDSISGGGSGTVESHDTIHDFDTSDPIFDSNGASDAEPDQGDWLALLKSDVTYGAGGATVTLTDWSNDAYYVTSDSASDETVWAFDSDPAFDTVGSPNVSIANARLVIVRTQGEDDQGYLPAESTPGVDWNESSSDNDIDVDFDYDYTQADDVDRMLAQQNGAFNGSVFVLTDNAGSSAGQENDIGEVYLWWDADVADQNFGNGKVDTVLVGVFHDVDDAEAFLGNVQWIDSWPMSS